jgi:hypothetical protein
MSDSPDSDDFRSSFHLPSHSSFAIVAKKEYTMIKPGRYRHYKGGEYEVFGLAKHSETEEEFVVYRQLYGPGGWWVRPKDMFVEEVLINGRAVPRFQLLQEGPL